MRRADLQTTILANAAAELRHLRALAWDGFHAATKGMDRDGEARLRVAVRDATEGILAVDWWVLLGGRVPVDSAEERACRRALERLERDGKVIRLPGDYGVAVNVKRIALTEAGLAAAPPAQDPLPAA